MKLLLTGCTGFVGRFVLRELLCRLDFEKNSVVCLLRAKKGHSVQDRWLSEICADTLFHGFSDKLAKISIQEGDLSHLAGIQWSDGKPECILHCAANVKTLDTYANLYADNVIGVNNICEAALQWSCLKLILISTCYVHPKTTVGKAVLLQADLPKSIFTTDYTYTKYLGEHVAASYKDKLQISLIRLSCVGAPCGWLDAHPTPGAMAHLGILSLMLRNKFMYARRSSTIYYLSIIPVDIVARSIVDTVITISTSDSVPFQIQQVCAKPEDSTWNMSMIRLFQTVKRLSPKIPMQIIDCSEAEFSIKLREFIGWSAWTPQGYKDLKFHEGLNDFITQFADGQRFESTVPDNYFPVLLDNESAYEQTCLYVARGNHQHLIEKGVKKTALDTFWTVLSSHDIIARIDFREPIEFESREDAISRIYNCCASYRPLFCAVEDPAVLKYQGNTRFAVRWADEDTNKNPVRLGCKSWTAASSYIELEGSGTKVSGFRLKGHHGNGDGAALIGFLPRINSLHRKTPLHTISHPSIRPSSLTWKQEFVCFIYYLATLILLMLQPTSIDLTDKKQHTVTRTIATASRHIEKNPGKTFTASLIEKSYTVFSSACQKETLIYCIPAIVQNPKDRGLNLPQNSFIPLFLPFTSNSDKNTLSFLCMKSKAVKMLSWAFMYAITEANLYWICEYGQKRIDVVFSSLLASDQNLDLIESCHYFAPTPDEVPFTVSAMTIGHQTHLSIGSSMKEHSADSLLKSLFL